MTPDFPTIYLLPAHFAPDELPSWENQIPTLTYDIHEADIVLTKISGKERARLELRSRNVLTDEIVRPTSGPDHASSPPAKRRRVARSRESAPGSESSTASDSQATPEDDRDDRDTRRTRGHVSPAVSQESGLKSGTQIIKVVRLAWFSQCKAKGSLLPLDEYVIYEGLKRPAVIPPTKPNGGDVLQRAREEGRDSLPTSSQGRFQRSFQRRAFDRLHPRAKPSTELPPLLQETTSEHDSAMSLPLVPDFLHTKFSCQRPTPFNSPNSAFIEQLKKVRAIRTLEQDEIAVRAYSTAIAAIAAYPYLISHAAEVARLPGCGPKIVDLYRQWSTTGCLDDIKKADASSRMKVLLLFYDIWGVAAKTAHEFYSRGWRDLDDIVEHGWDRISRVQQIGVKYYDELQEKIPRAEVEQIANTILEHANGIRKGYQMVIVGGYRRGKSSSGDVDVIISHTDPAATLYLVNDLVSSLEKAEYITHTLLVSERNSQRGQTALGWKGEDRKSSGFDTLDKALVVWQDPGGGGGGSTMPRPHRRVDIIISPWKTAGCAVMGWTGGTTFERDLRRYCKEEHGLKFDSSGVRRRGDGGEWVDLESDADGRPAPDMLTAEKRAFAGLGLEWRPPEERCTG
ncbi:hypothetical protein GGR56DRAFT_110429 [Xylariaceae sp. FL0804]|nr:hypothetical protein GGR56DRAFT_110429 [Xylariaceae sp. FL0804]